MKFDKQHIEMCRKAVKIQTLWEPEPFDLMCVIGLNEIFVLKEWYDKYPVCWGFSDKKQRTSILDKPFKEKYHWIPTQAQLQEIFLKEAKKIDGEKFNNIGGSKILLEMFYEFWSGWPEDEWIYDMKNVSMEQLWLALTMSLLTEKTWTGTDWE